ncbi:hypothetical protein AB0N89_37235 [Amycolatopsis sp. NPDC089917]|uniref:hypothetical protein n=1 Tax=Amycolatopsis sp. NPDC089917 TaxID=3155187 RepID=UPI00343FBCF0
MVFVAPEGAPVATQPSVPMLMDRRRTSFLVAAGGIMLFLAVFLGFCFGFTEKDPAGWAGSTEVVVDVILAVGLLTAAIACAIALRHSRKIGEAPVDTWLPTETAVAREPGFEVLPQRFHTMSLLAIPTFWACAVALGLVVWFSVAFGSPAPAILPGIPLALGCAGGLSTWVGWDRRAKSVRKTGWYAAKVVDIEVFSADDGRLPVISVRPTTPGITRDAAVSRCGLAAKTPPWSSCSKTAASGKAFTRYR